MSIVQIDVDIVKICGGETHTLFLSATGEIYSCGNFDYGVLGVVEKNAINIIETIPNVIDIAAGDRQSFCIDNTGIHTNIDTCRTILYSYLFIQAIFILGEWDQIINWDQTIIKIYMYHWY
nr:hypothetical protein NeseNPV-TR_ORF68 [Neodiprion sertifer nucleopolyhedrovirus]